jgi:hypothetical protein
MKISRVYPNGSEPYYVAVGSGPLNKISVQAKTRKAALLSWAASFNQQANALQPVTLSSKA